MDAKKPPNGSTGLQKASRFLHHEAAKVAGFAENTHPYHVQAGNWIRGASGSIIGWAAFREASALI